MRTAIAALLAALACLGSGCAPGTTSAHPAEVAAQQFLDACGEKNSGSWRSHLIEAEQTGLPWSPTWSAGARCALLEASGDEALVRVTLAHDPTPTHPLVLHREQGVWRISMRESLIAWAVDPRNDARLLAGR